MSIDFKLQISQCRQTVNSMSVTVDRLVYSTQSLSIDFKHKFINARRFSSSIIVDRLLNSITVHRLSNSIRPLSTGFQTRHSDCRQTFKLNPVFADRFSNSARSLSIDLKTQFGHCPHTFKFINAILIQFQTLHSQCRLTFKLNSLFVDNTSNSIKSFQ